MIKTKVEFINHASVHICNGSSGILCDPWYSGDAFHLGWNLLFENDREDIERVLSMTTHIWISHEHPDHFSIKFFKEFGDLIKRLSITIIFQKTNDKRVLKFLIGSGFIVVELNFNEPMNLSHDMEVTCIKDGFYDSGLLIKSGDEKILNLNDCEITTQQRAREVKKIVGNVDVLLTQFSFAAWKGGEENITWRKEAADEKIKTINLQIKTFEPKFLIPFASFIYFSNEENFYLNDSINTPRRVIDECDTDKCSVIVMQPYDTLGSEEHKINISKACDFWDEKYKALQNKLVRINSFPSIKVESLKENFHLYSKRFNKDNNFYLMFLLRYISPISIFKPVKIYLEDLNQGFFVDPLMGRFCEINEPCHLKMQSASLEFLFKNTFGFDTLTVNGCFNEGMHGGFAHATKTLAVENLNNLGIRVALATCFNFRIIKMFVTRLLRVARKLEA